MTMMIEDEELRSLYQTTCSGRLWVLESGLLEWEGHFEKGHANDELLETLRREAHSLKGDSRVMGLEEVATLSHQVERAVKALQQRSIDWSPSLSDAAGQALTVIAQLVQSATTGPAVEVDAQAVSHQLELALSEVSSAMSGTVSSTMDSSNSGGEAKDATALSPTSAEPSAPVISGLSVFGSVAESVVEASTESRAGLASLSASFIEDVDLRALYRSTSERRLQKISAALGQLLALTSTDQSAQRKTALTAFRYEAQGLRGDSLEVGQGAIAAITRQFEAIANRLMSQSIELTPALEGLLSQGLQQIEQLVYQAVTASVEVLPSASVTQLLDALAIEQSVSQSQASFSGSAQSLDALGVEGLSNRDINAATLPPFAAEQIEDEELRDIYKRTTEGRLQALEMALLALEHGPADHEAMTTAVREAHSLKGDAQSMQIEAIELLAQVLEIVLKRLKRQEILLTPELSYGFRENLVATGALVQTVTTGAAHSVPVVHLTQTLLELAEQATIPDDEPSVQFDEAGLEDQQDAARVDAVTAGELDEVSAETVSESEPVPVSAIEDDELREVYRVVSSERVQRLELGLATLEKSEQAEDARQATLTELLREAHSLKGDARSVGLDEVEQLAHAIEDVFIGLQRQAIALSPEMGDGLYRGLDAIAHLVEAAVTGIANESVEPESLLQALQALLPAANPLADSLAHPPASSPAQVEENALPELSATLSAESFTPVLADTLPPIDAQLVILADGTPPATKETSGLSSGLGTSGLETSGLETIRVQARDLDALAAQSEQLTLTRIQTAQTAARMTALIGLWEKFRTHNKLNQPAQSGELNPFENQLDAAINKLRLATQENSFRLDLISQDMGQRVQNLRLLPVDNILRGFPRMVRDLARQQSKSVELVVEGGETTADKRILEDIQDSLMHLVRNAIDHGIETVEAREAAGKPATAQLRIRSYQSPNSIVIEVSDDGKGLDLDQIKQTAVRRKLYSSDDLDGFSPGQLQDLVFVPGFSTRSFTTEISGRGVGLDIVRSQIERLKGNVQIESEPGKGCLFRLQIRTQLATANVVFVNVRGVIHGIPIEFLQTTMRVSQSDIVNVDGLDSIAWRDRTVPVRDLFDVLELANSPAYRPPVNPEPARQRACLLLRVGDELGAFLVDRLLDTQEVVFKPQSTLLKRIRNVTGMTILGNGEVCSILNPPDLVKSIQREKSPVAVTPKALTQVKPLILLVEDSPPVRIQEKRLFENAGYEVVTAEDGLKGYEILQAGSFDAVISDIEMPNLDGLALTAKIRQNPDYEELPIILVTTLSSELDRRRGADAGASAYIVKGKFNQEALLETLHRLI